LSRPFIAALRRQPNRVVGKDPDTKVVFPERSIR
jgi:hypothetical protein